MLYRKIKIGRIKGGALENMQTGKVGFTPIDARPQGEDGTQTVPVYLAMSCPYGIEPERLEEADG